jgi:hypothetical protein
MTFPASLRVAIAVACGFFQELFLHPDAGAAGKHQAEPGKLLKSGVGFNQLPALPTPF